MQKSLKRFLSMLVALALIIGMVPASVLAEGDAQILQGWNLTLGDNIGVNFHLAEDAGNYDVTVTVAGNDAAYEANGSVISVGVAAAQMTDTIVLTVKDGEETVHAGEYSVRQYAETILGGEYANYVKQLVKQMLNYGAAAQNYFAYNTTNLANSGYEADAVALPESVEAAVAEGNVDGITYYGASLLFKSKVAVRFYFVSDDVSGYQFSQGTLGEKNGMHYVEIGDINPQDLDKQIELTVTGGESAITVKYSPLNYIYNKSNNAGSSESLKTLMQALYGYHTAAKVYIAPPIVDMVDLGSHSNGWNSTSAENPGGATFVAAENDAPYATDWSLRYTPVRSDAIKLIRDGVETNAANTGAETIIKYSATEYYLEFWPFSQKPILAGDEMIIEGLFYNAANDTYIDVEKTCLIFNADNTVTVIKDGYINAGSLGNHSNGMNGTDGIYATMAANSAPYNGWSIEYAPLTNNAYYVIRDGEQINIGMPGRGTLVKYSDTEYYLKLTQWCTDNFAFTTDDIIVVEGLWKQNTDGNAVMKIEKTYLYYDGSAWVFATELPVVVNGGLMQTHSNGMSGNGIYFTMDANDAPYNTDWSLEYTQTSADNIKLIRDGETLSIGIVGRPLIIKYGESDYYLKLEGWNVGDYGVNGQSSAITTDDILIVEGDFEYENVTLNITKSYVYYDGSAWVCSATAPVQNNIVELVDLSVHSANGWSSTSADVPGGAYFTVAENDAPYATDWSLRYTPVSSDVIKLIRDGVETSIANTGAETIIKYSATEYYLEFWPFSQKPMLAGDVMIIEGQFYNAANNTYIDVEKTYFTLNAGGTITILNDADKYIDGGAMSAYETNWLNNGFYFAMESNGLPYNAAQEDWSVEYAPTSTAAIKLIRDGVTTESARVGAGTMIKLADGQYYMKIEGWTITSISSKDDLVDGDILVVEGDFFNESNGYTLHIDKSYITFTEGNVTFSTAASTDFGELLLPNSADKLNIGMWNGSYHVFEHKQLQELQAAGITKIVGIDTQWIGTTDVNAWLDRVYSYGISVVFDLRGWDGVTVPDYASHPGVLGFLMWDEPSTTDFATLADLKAKFDAIEDFNGKLFYVNLLASCVADSSLFGESYNTSQTDYDTYYVTKFLDTLDIDVLSWDNYSLISQADDTTAKGIRTDYFYNFEVMASKASENLPLWYIMLSAGHNSGAENTIYNTPTAGELRWQMAVAMTYGVKNIDHYVYVSHAEDYSSMVEYDTWEPTDLYYDIKAVDNEYLAWDNIFTAYDWVGVGKYSANSKDTMLDQLENSLTLSDYGIASVSASDNLLVGVFDYNGDKAYMVTNAGSTSTSWFSGDVGDGREFNMVDNTVTLTLDDADYKCVAVIDNGQISYVAVENNTVTLNVEAYEGVFVIPVLN